LRALKIDKEKQAFLLRKRDLPALKKEERGRAARPGKKRGERGTSPPGALTSVWGRRPPYLKRGKN